MNKNICVFLLVLFQYESGTSGTAADTGSSKIQDQATILLDRLKDRTQQELDKGLLTITGITSGAYDYRDQVLQNATAKINEEYERYNQELAGIQATAKSEGVDVSACFKEELFRKLPENTVSSLAECLTIFDERLKEVEKQSDRLKNVINREVSSFGSQIDRCGRRALCISSVSKEIGLSIAKVSQTIRSEVETAKEEVQEQRGWINNCLKSKTKLYENEAKALVSSISLCIKRRLS